MLAETMSSCIVFSDNEDELKAHAGLLDSAHDNISHQGFQLISPLKTKATPGQERKISTDYENEGNYFDKDPVFRCLLRDKKRPLQDVFIRPMEPPPKNLNEYEFKLECGTSVFPVKTSQKGFLFYRNGSPVNVTSPSLDTLQTVKRRRDRLVHKALIAIASRTKSSDDEEYVPMTLWGRTIEENETTPTTRKLRTRKREWTSDDDLPLDALILKISSDAINKCSRTKNSPSIQEKHMVPNRKRHNRVLASWSDSDDELFSTYHLKRPKIQLKRVHWPIREVPKTTRTRVDYSHKGSKRRKEGIHGLFKCLSDEMNGSTMQRLCSTEPVAKKRRIVNQDNGDQIESNMDIPLSNFLTPKSTRRKTLRSCRILQS